MDDTPEALRCVALRQLALAKACVPERRAAVEFITQAQAALGPRKPPHEGEVLKVLESTRAVADDGHAYLADPTEDNRRFFVAAMRVLRDRIGVALGVMEPTTPAPTLERQAAEELTPAQKRALKSLPEDGEWWLVSPGLWTPALTDMGLAEQMRPYQDVLARLTPEGQRVRAEILK